MLVAMIVGCAVGVSDPTPQQCVTVTSPSFFETEEACELNALELGVPYLLENGYSTHEIQCVELKMFKEGEPV